MAQSLAYVYRHKNTLKTNWVARLQNVQHCKIPESFTETSQRSAGLQKLQQKKNFPNTFATLFSILNLFFTSSTSQNYLSSRTPRNLSLPKIEKQKYHRTHLGITLIEHASEIRKEIPKIITVVTFLLRLLFCFCNFCKNNFLFIC